MTQSPTSEESRIPYRHTDLTDVVEASKNRRFQPEHLPSSWGQTREIFLRAAAELAALYPEETFFILARDGEYLFDLWRALAPLALSGRLKLINVNRQNCQSPLLDAYLAQEGLNEEALAKRRAIIVDTGVAGTIYQAIHAILPSSLQKQVVAHYLVSSNVRIPSLTAAFGQEISTPREDAFRARSAFLEKQVEGISHATRRSDGFLKFSDRVEAMTYVSDSFHRTKTESIRADLKEYGQSNPARQLYDRLFSTMRPIVDHLHGVRELPDGEWADRVRVLETLGASLFVEDLLVACVAGTLDAPRKIFAKFQKEWRQ